jgi:hypothetical protein
MSAPANPISVAAHPRRRRIWRGLLVILGLLVAGALLNLWVLWPWMSRWGATEEEMARPLPGDDLVPEPTIQTTKGVTVRAAPAEIYPWLLQLGVDRGGMYSYDRLENLFGLDVHTVDTIVPAYQNPRPGDFWRFTPADYLIQPGPGLWVRELRKNEAVLLCFGLEDAPEEACTNSWQFILEPRADGTTRLLLRSRMAVERALPIKLSYFVQFIMERKMLLEIGHRAERLADRK